MNIVSIEDIAEKVDYGYTASATDEKIGPKFLRITDIKDNVVDWDEVPYCECSEKDFHKNKIEKWDIVFARTGSTGNSFIIKDDVKNVVFASYLIRLKVNSEVADPEFVAYFFQSDNYWRQIKKGSDGTTMPSFNATKLKALKIPLPSLSEQKAIVAKLDRAQRLIDIDKEMLAKYDELIQSVFLEMFGDPVTNSKGWKVKSLKEACSKVTDGTHDTPERLDFGVPLITGKNIRSFKIDFRTTDFVSQEDHEKIYKRCNPEFGDVLYVNIGAGIGTAAFNNIHEEFSMKNVALLKPKSGVLCGRYLESCLNNEVMKEKIKYIASLGGAQKFLGLGDIRKLKVPVPDTDLQEKFDSYYTKIEKEKTKTLESIKKSEELFSSLVQRAFG